MDVRHTTYASVIAALVMAFVMLGTVFYIIRHAPPSHPALDACVQVDLRSDLPGGNMSYNRINRHIRTMDANWISLYGRKESKDDIWVPVSNVAAILPSEECDSGK